jgi:putative transposase
MPWLDTNPMDERMRFIVAHEQGLYSMSELCERHGISRQAGYNRLKRYEAAGIEGLKDRSHAPKHCPHKISPEVAEALIQLRRQKPDWGPKTLLGRLAIIRPDLQLPAPSTVGDLLAREGLVTPRRRRVRPAVSTGGVLRTSRPNEIWSADYKGQFRTLDGKYCYPITIQDAHTRFVLTIDALLSTSTEEAQPSFERTFREHGLPEGIWTDNGPPFAVPTPLRLTRLNALVDQARDHAAAEPAGVSARQRKARADAPEAEPGAISARREPAGPAGEVRCDPRRARLREAAPRA